MKFFEKIARAMGFGGDGSIEDDPLYADTTANVMPEKRDDEGVSAEKKVASLVEFSPEMQDAIFEKVLAVFNESLPEFLSKTVDVEAQKRYLRESLDAGIAQYLESLKKAAETYCEEQWRGRQSEMSSRLDEVKLRAEEVERQSVELRQKQLSADRQKRALTEKVHDLESQLAKLASEREQFELENRSLVSRLKSSSVRQEDLDKIREENNQLKDELKRLREDPSLIATELENELKTALADAQESIKLKDKEIAEMSELVAQFDAATSRFDEINARLKSCQNQIVIQEKTIAEKDAEINSLKLTVAENLKRQTEREQLLRKEIEDMRAPMTFSAKEINFDDDHEGFTAPRISEEDLSDIDAEFAMDDSDRHESESAPAPFVAVEKPVEEESFPEVEDIEEHVPVTAEARSIYDLSEDDVKQKENRPKKKGKKQKPEQLSLF